MAKRYLDKYYTPTSVVKAVLKVIEKDIMPLNKFSRIIEPSAGDGAFLKLLPKGSIGYDIAPEYDGIIEGDYLKQDIPYMKDSIVIGNPPFGRSGSLVKDFIRKSMECSDYVAFVIPGDNYKRKSSIKGVKLLKSYMLPEVKYSGVLLKCCFNIYSKGVEEILKLKDVEFYNFSRSKKTTQQEEKEYLNKKADYRLVMYGGSIGLVGMTEHTRVSELKILFKNKVNFKPVIESYIEKKKRNNISTPRISRQEVIKLIWDTYPELRG